MEPIVNRCKGFIKTLKGAIVSKEYPAGLVYKKEIGYDKRETMLESITEPGWELFENGSRFGGKDRHACFISNFTITEEMAGQNIWMQLRTGVTDIWNTDNPQFLVYINDEVICGMDMNHNNVCVACPAVAGTTFKIGVYAYSNSATISDYFNLSFYAKQAEVEKLYYDCSVLMDAAMELRPDDLERMKMLDAIQETLNRTELRYGIGREFYESVPKADKWLCENYYDKLKGEATVRVHSIGHTHIDVAWKWPVRQTREKALRSFATVLRYMDEYPAYRFLSSQPQLYSFVKEAEPKLFERIKERVKEGRWETEGAMWLEADCNLTSGESLVRQIIHGNRFFKEEFGKGDNKILWLPDVFGYSAALPQIMRKSGIDYFMTTKIGWNEFNKMPHDVFNWKGIDGTEVLTYFITTTEHKLYPELVLNPRHETTYNGRQNVTQIMGTWQRFSDKDLSTDVLTCYGHGDGGGGPTREMLEVDKRMALGLPGCPVTKQTFAGEFFEILSKNLEGKKVPKWNGELYLEYHRGTYTSQASVKNLNRRAEFTNEEAEFLSVWAGLANKGFKYPEAELEGIWKKTLLNQFHDILPGSSLAEVYEVTNAELKSVLLTDETLIKNAQEALFTKEEENVLTIVNTLPFDIDSYVDYNDKTAYVKNIPGKGYLTVNAADLTEDVSSSMKAAKTNEGMTIETPLYECVIDSKGEISKLYDKRASRLVNKPGEALNALVAFEDRPWEYDCWNIDSTYEAKQWPVNEVVDMKLVKETSEKITVELVKKFLNSTITQNVSFYAKSPRIDFKTSVDWNESQILLKAAFPVDVCTNKCTADIQFGNVERPTHQNTSWDSARFEMCIQKWVDVSESGYGAAILNDCKYGCDVNESTMRLTLIKSGIFPDPKADVGHHEFTYALYPHEGDFRDGGVIEEAYKLNVPLRLLPGKASDKPSDRLYKLEGDGVFASTIKPAEDGNGYVIRLHEEKGRRTTFKLDLSKFAASEIVETNLMEKEIEGSFSYKDGILSATIKPYEIKTYRI